MKKSNPAAKKSRNIGTLLGENLAKARHAKGWTQQELAEKIGVDPVTLSRIETGTSLPSISRLSDISDVLDISLTNLVSGISQHVTDQSQEISILLQKLCASDRLLVVDILKQFANRLSKKQ